MSATTPSLVAIGDTNTFRNRQTNGTRIGKTVQAVQCTAENPQTADLGGTTFYLKPSDWLVLPPHEETGEVTSDEAFREEYLAKTSAAMDALDELRATQDGDGDE